jgi:2-oxoglutarate/2-oxoacid ferredoxin oxidoreductase subunit beta
MAMLPGTVYSVRRSLHDARHVMQAKKAIKTAFEAQIAGLFSIVELLSTCPTNWKMDPAEACNWVAENMVPQYPLGDYKVDESLQKRRR